VLFTVLHALALYGAIFFRKLPFIKTGFIFFIGLVAVVVSNSLFLRVLVGVPVEKMQIPFGNFNFWVGERQYSIGTASTTSSLTVVLLLTVAVLIWVAAYFRLREKQI
jgi:hypothetical protein